MVEYIITFTGKKFYPAKPFAPDIDIKDIAHALALECRFSGHCKQFYSVAEHCLRVSFLCEKIAGPLSGLYGLLHDASEAYLRDIPTPLKYMPIFEGYRDIEHTLEDMIFSRFGLSPRAVPEVVKHADRVIFVTEARDLMPPGSEFQPMSVDPLEEIIVPMRHEAAEKSYLSRFYDLTS